MGDEGVLSDLTSTRGVSKAQVEDRVLELKAEILETATPMSPQFTAAKAIKKSSFASKPWATGLEDPEERFAELDVLHGWLSLKDEESTAKKAKRDAENALLKEVLKKYAALTENEIKDLVVEDKWFGTVRRRVEAEVERVTRLFADRVRTLTDRYGTPLPELEQQAEEATRRVEGHLQAMGLSWR
jgi:hypothetical protein